NYVPAVVFVTADEVAGATDSGGFSAPLSWAGGYGARGDEGGPDPPRLLRWGGGAPATPPPVAPRTHPPVSPGGSPRFWPNRVPPGAGYNLFADSNDDGRFYYTIGSSLIPLLQALQPDTQQ